MIEKTKTALEAGSCGSRVLGMPGPMGTQDAKIFAYEKYRERSRQVGKNLSASPVRVTKCALLNITVKN